MNNRDIKGFTLIEILIAVSILALIFTTAYRSLQQIGVSKSLLDDERESLLIANTLTNRLSREIQMIIQDGEIQHPSVSEGERVSLMGTSQTIGNNRGDSLIFVANEAGQYLPQKPASSSLVTVSYRVERDPENVNSYVLIRDEIPNLGSREASLAAMITFPVAKNLTSFELSYYNNSNKSWTNDWSQQRSLPSLVHFRFSILTKDGRELLFSSAVPLILDSDL